MNEQKEATLDSLQKCAIWPDFTAECYQSDIQNRVEFYDSLRTDGEYRITREAKRELLNIGLSATAPRVRARLTTILVELRRDGEEIPLVNTDLIKRAHATRDLHPHERAQRLLEHLVEVAPSMGDFVRLDAESTLRAWIHTESTGEREFNFLASYLKEKGLITAGMEFGNHLRDVRVTLDGYAQIAEIRQAIDPAQAFVAMWFDDEVRPLYLNGIKPAIRVAGYKEFRIDEKSDADKIDDEIIAEIRRSKFIVADLTQGEKGARGGVYYEAGFAYGLGKPVIYTCRKDLIDEVHFDTRQFSHILWENPEDVVEPLTQRILARIGEGPNIARS